MSECPALFLSTPIDWEGGPLLNTFKNNGREHLLKYVKIGTKRLRYSPMAEKRGICLILIGENLSNAPPAGCIGRGYLLNSPVDCEGSVC
jgi:hypothetical protein